MISSTPSLVTQLRSTSGSDGIASFLERQASVGAYYGSGKVALRDGLAGLVEAGENVLVPAYLPDAVVEPLRELGLEPRYYRLRETLAADLADVERRLDGETVAVVSIDYFGFPQPGFADFTALVDDHDCYHVDDNAHAPISVDEGTVLGTRGDLGITSLRKLLPIPNGAVLYCTDDAVAAAYEPSSLAGVRDHYAIDDCRHVLTSLVGDLLEANAALRRWVEALVDDRAAPASDPRTRYEAGKTPMSKLSARVVASADPTAIREARRANYRAWRRCFESRSDVDVLYRSLPPGICPQVCPVRAARPKRLLADLERCGVGGAHTWPRLPAAVRTDPAYEVTRRLAREIVVLPVHQHIDPSSIAAVGDRLRRPDPSRRSPTRPDSSGRRR